MEKKKKKEGLQHAKGNLSGKLWKCWMSVLYITKQYPEFLSLHRIFFNKQSTRSSQARTPSLSQLLNKSASPQIIRALAGITGRSRAPAVCGFRSVAMVISSTIIPWEPSSKFRGNQSRTKKWHPSKSNREIMCNKHTYTLSNSSFQKIHIFRTERSVEKKLSLHSPNSKLGWSRE